MRLTLPLPRPVDEETARELVKESVFVSRDIRSMRVEGAAVVVELADGSDRDANEDKLRRYLAGMVGDVRMDVTRTLRRTAREDPGHVQPDVFDELLRRGWLFALGPGHFAFGGPALALSRWIDDHARALYERFDPVERCFPALIGADLLARCGYLDSHPNNVTLVTHLVEDLDTIEAFRRANAGATYRSPDAASLAPPGHGLNPAACLPAYATLEDQSVPRDGMALTWLGRVFRYESRNTRALERLWEFNVRELVLVGPDDYVEAGRLRAVDVVADLASALDLDAAIQVATDPFFATVAAARKFWQRAIEAKYEVRLDVGGGWVAAGSINAHGTHFSERFGIDVEGGQRARTGCVGLGIERWLFAAFAQHGCDAGRWPEAVRGAVFPRRGA